MYLRDPKLPPLPQPLRDSFRLVCFDADGTLRETTVPGQVYPKGPREWRLKRNVVTTLRAMRVDKYAIASNQSGVFTGAITQELAQQLVDDLADEVFPTRSQHLALICPHKKDGGCSCRKPAPGMLLKAMSRFHAYPNETLFVGDMDTDKEAAFNAGAWFAWAHDFFGWGSPKPGVDRHAPRDTQG